MASHSLSAAFPSQSCAWRCSRKEHRLSPLVWPGWEVGLGGSALCRGGMECIHFHTTIRSNSDTIYSKNLTAKVSNLWKLCASQITQMLGTASTSSQEGCAGTWLDEWVKKLHTKLLVSQLVQTHRKAIREIQIALPVWVYSQLTSACSTEVKVWRYLYCFNGQVI